MIDVLEDSHLRLCACVRARAHKWQLLLKSYVLDGGNEGLGEQPHSWFVRGVHRSPAVLMQEDPAGFGGGGGAVRGEEESGGGTR